MPSDQWVVLIHSSCLKRLERKVRGTVCVCVCLRVGCVSSRFMTQCLICFSLQAPLYISNLILKLAEGTMS